MENAETLKTKFRSFRVLQLYPHSPHKIGDIIPPTNGGLYKLTARKGRYTYVDIAEMAKYVALFRLLAWWDDLPEEELPLFVKDTIKGTFHRVIKYLPETLHKPTPPMFFCTGQVDKQPLWYYEPATEAEYEASKENLLFP